MKPRKKDIISARGDSIYRTIRFKDPTLSVTSLIMSCKAREKDVAYIFQKTLDDGIAYVEDGIYRIRVAPEDTQALPAGDYYFDIQVTTGNDVYTPIKGVIRLLTDITLPEGGE